LKNILPENNLLDKPGQIYNVDESGMPLDHCSPHVVALKAVLDHEPYDQMVTLRAGGVDLTTASTLVQRDTENGGSIA